MFKVFVSKRPILDADLASIDQLDRLKALDMAYFDENIQIVAVTPASVKQVELDLIYNVQNTISHSLKDSTRVGDHLVWVFGTTVIADKLSNELKIKASYQQEVVNNTVSSEFENSLQIGSTLLSQHVDNFKSFSSTSTIRIRPIFQMRFKTIKTEKTMASLELALSGQFRESGASTQIESVGLLIQNCDVVSYSNLKYPLTLPKNSNLSLTYKLVNNDTKWMKPVLVTIACTVNAKRHIITKWNTNVDFQAAPAVAPIPSPSLGVLKSRSTNSALSLVKKSRPKSNSSLNLSHTRKNLNISVSGQTKVKLGEVFKWKLQFINKSNDSLSLILYIQSSINKEYEKSVPPIPLQNSGFNKADPVPLYALGQLVRAFKHEFNKAGLISLTNNLKFTLDPGNLFETELELIGIEKGLVNLHDVRVLEIKSGEIFECGRLLDVLVV
ncbi:hypothetical protein OGAPHI_006531 [Ogataea philodendri]|uniref:Trafficking protein particle complex II-specific subunit 65 IgD3 domain-containing protein n=1 Tax=Ogataea philodendri TaxID=1378263 RepID=A0A9P8T0P6_9ASCO|nr:uncharacterized protein OGAPHI_006531 [Ogataea philodendri]KAH3661681.1 hypothetical protein OGAPHI_006531 [Ogataea philodendri]